TASFGSPLDSRLSVLRAFRSKILNQFALGKRFIHFYYKKGPYAGKWVAENPWSRPLLQVIIWPLWAFAWLSLHWNLPLALLFAFLSFAIPAAVLISFRKKTPQPQLASSEESAFE